MVEQEGYVSLVAESCEYAVQLNTGEDPDYIPQEARYELTEEEREAYHEATQGNKIGGTPGFLQNDEFPGPDYSKLIAQLDSPLLPFDVNFGDSGIGYVFLSQDGRSGKFLWQCC